MATKEVKISDLREWYETLPVAEVLRKLDATHPSALYRLLRQAGIPLKSKKVKLVK